MLVLFGASACDTYACQWTDEPFPDPVQTHELEQRYATDDGAFEIVLHADGEWPLVAGTTSLRIEATQLEETPPMLYVDRPYVYGGELVAPTEPVIVEMRPGQWQVDALVLEAEGIWALPVWLEQGEVDDSIELYIEVVDDDA